MHYHQRGRWTAHQIRVYNLVWDFFQYLIWLSSSGKAENLVSSIACVVADSQQLNREGLLALLRTQPQFRVLGVAGTVRETAALIEQRRPDLLVLDTRLPGTNGASAIEAILKLSPGTRILALVDELGQDCQAPRNHDNVDITGIADNDEEDQFPCCDELDCIGQALANGAHAVLPRSVGRVSFFRAARAVAANRPWFAAESVHRIAGCLVHRRSTDAAHVLSSRERQVAILVADGLCNKEIGVRLDIQNSTVKKHIGHILAKLHLRDRLQVGLFVSRAHPFGDDTASTADASTSPK